MSGSTRRLRSKIRRSGETSSFDGSRAVSPFGLHSSACAPVPLDKDDVAEAIAFLEWLRDDNFTFLGMREFHADIAPADDTRAVDWTEDLGIMLHSVTYNDRTAKESYDWFDAKVDEGHLRIPRLGLLAEQNAGVVT